MEGGEAAETGGLAAADAVLDAGVRTVAGFQMLQGAFAVRGVGEEDLVAHAFVEIEQGQLGTGMWALAPHDEPGAVRVVGQIHHAGQFCHFGAGPQGAVLLQRRVPQMVGQGPDCAADRFGDGVSDGEGGVDTPLAQCSDVGEEGFCASGAVGADEDAGAVTVGVGDLGQGRVQDGDVVGGGVGTGVARPQHSGQGFAGVVQEAQQRVVAEPAFVGGRCLFLVRVAGDEGGIEVQDQARQIASAGAGRGQAAGGLGGLQPGDLPGSSSRRAQAGECGRADAGQQAPGGQGGGDRTEDLRLVPQHGQVRYRLAAVGEHHCQIDRDPAEVVPGATRSKPAQRVRERAGQASDIGEIGQQPGSGMADHPAAVGGDDELRTRPGSVHAESAFLLW